MDEQNIRHILVVDDEPHIVSAIQRELNTPPHGHFRYEVSGCTDPQQALALATHQAFDAVISDYRMPGMDGLEFLKALAQLQPDCVRLVLSGQTDMGTLVRMVNETHIYRFIPKPWHDYYLKSCLAQAIRYATVLRHNRQLAETLRQQQIPLPAAPEPGPDRILIVDHDPAVLEAMTRVLTQEAPEEDLYQAIRTETAQTRRASQQASRLEVIQATSARHALELAANQAFACIVAERKMPDMDGLELLQRFADLQPDCSRVLISQSLNEQDLIQAIGGADIYAFVHKPWSDFELKTHIAQALAHRHMRLENRHLAEVFKSAIGK